uniref:RIIa domain-containing protein n=1 Tax=Salmo trutta TaxID=8032 RepID=A0A674AN79_SALTR
MISYFFPPLTIIITYGLKSWLECLCRAILIEGPRQIPEFIAAYCDELLEFRELQNVTFYLKVFSDISVLPFRN